MPELMVINGEYMTPAEGRVSAEDRGFTFADGVYEVMRIYGGVAFTLREHLERLERSASGIDLQLPHTVSGLEAQMTELVDRAGLPEAMLYLQVTRGAAPRNHLYADSLAPTVMAFVRPGPPRPEAWNRDGAMALPMPDTRGTMCNLKTIALLPSVLAKNRAVRAGGAEALFHLEDGTVTEGSSSNAYAVRDGEVWTAPLSHKILPGITRMQLVALCQEMGIRLHEQALTLREFEEADEVIMSATNLELLPVTRLGARSIGAGKPGPVYRRLCEAYRERVRTACGAMAAETR